MTEKTAPATACYSTPVAPQRDQDQALRAHKLRQELAQANNDEAAFAAHDHARTNFVLGQFYRLS